MSEDRLAFRRYGKKCHSMVARLPNGNPRLTLVLVRTKINVKSLFYY